MVLKIKQFSFIFFLICYNYYDRGVYMDNKMLFMIYNGEIKFLNNSTMDHREWYDSLGGDPNLYDNTSVIVAEKIQTSDKAY